jgi:hypothetical protein
VTESQNEVIREQASRVLAAKLKISAGIAAEVKV